MIIMILIIFMKVIYVGKHGDGHHQAALKPGDSAVIFSRAMDLKCAKGDLSNVIININTSTS